MSGRINPFVKDVYMYFFSPMKTLIGVAEKRYYVLTGIKPEIYLIKKYGVKWNTE